MEVLVTTGAPSVSCGVPSGMDADAKMDVSGFVACSYGDLYLGMPRELTGAGSTLAVVDGGGGSYIVWRLSPVGSLTGTSDMAFIELDCGGGC